MRLRQHTTQRAAAVSENRLSRVAAEANQRLTAYLEMMARAEAAVHLAALSPSGSPSAPVQVSPPRPPPVTTPSGRTPATPPYPTPVTPLPPPSNWLTLSMTLAMLRGFN